METTSIQQDIEGLTDIEVMVREFYERIYQDEVLRPIFQDVAKVDLEAHLPIMNRFWHKLLFKKGDYDGNPFQVHKKLHSKIPLNECHFLRWVNLFKLTVDYHFSGPVATNAKRSAEAISYSFQSRLAPNSINPYFKETSHE